MEHLAEKREKSVEGGKERAKKREGEGEKFGISGREREGERQREVIFLALPFSGNI